MVLSKIKILFISVAFVLITACNPFAPTKYSGESQSALLGDQMTVEGLFQNWRYAYTVQDTSVYSQLLHEDFTFVYRNYDDGVDYSWGKEVDMRSTKNLFDSTESIELIWNDIIFEIGDSLSKNISRSFNLQLTFDASDVTRIGGRANLQLTRNSTESVWKIIEWRDESNY